MDTDMRSTDGDYLALNERVALALNVKQPATRREIADAVARVAGIPAPTSHLGVAFLSAIAVGARDFVEQSGRITEAEVGHVITANAIAALGEEAFKLTGPELGLRTSEAAWSIGVDLVEAAGRSVG